MIDGHLQLAVFHLNDLCVVVQEGMDNYLATAALEIQPGTEATFTWLRRRGVRICLLSDYGKRQTQLLLRRLCWTVAEDGTVQQLITHQQRRANPVALAQEHAALADPRLSMAVVDTPALLRQARAAGVHLNLAVCNGRAAYHQLAVVPHDGMLDNLRQLPNFVLQHLPDPGTAGHPVCLPRPHYTG